MPGAAIQSESKSLALRFQARTRARLVRERWLHGLVVAVTLLVVAAMTAIPVFLAGSTGFGAIPWRALWPLLAGSLKAACYALLVAVPLGLGAAIWCARFAAPRMRAWLKPMFELFEALPAVVLGLIAALTLAPWLARHVLALAILIAVLPLGLGLAAWAWQVWAPAVWRRRIEGREILLTIPLVILFGVLALRGGELLASPWLQAVLLPGTPWNALVIGLVLGLAVMPVVFTLAEEALFEVPASLADGAHALGATRWQALVAVIVPVAAPGILAALLLGFSRAFGETMIVLMASGNTPLADAGAFTGLRTIAANLALEAPEAASGSPQYRLLMLSALVLFGVCFLLNAVAEQVRLRLRRRIAGL